MMFAPSEMDKGAPEVGDESLTSEEPIPILLPAASNTLALGYEVGTMRRSSGYPEVHSSTPALQAIP